MVGPKQAKSEAKKFKCYNINYRNCCALKAFSS